MLDKLMLAKTEAKSLGILRLDFGFINIHSSSSSSGLLANLIKKFGKSNINYLLILVPLKGIIIAIFQFEKSPQID